MNKNFKAAVFDLDGTLANTLDTIHYYVQKTLDIYSLGTVTKKQVCDAVGCGAKNLILGVLRTIGQDEKSLLDKVLDTYLSLYNEEPMYLTSVYDGMDDCIKKLMENNIKLAVLSNKQDKSVQDVIKILFGEGIFDLCAGQVEGKPIKPDPSVLFEMLDKMEVSPEETVYVGDTIVDMKTGKNAGAYTVGVLWGFRGPAEFEEGNADTIISHPKELCDIILGGINL